MKTNKIKKIISVFLVVILMVGFVNTNMYGFVKVKAAENTEPVLYNIYKMDGREWFFYLRDSSNGIESKYFICLDAVIVRDENEGKKMMDCEAAASLAREYEHYIVEATTWAVFSQSYLEDRKEAYRRALEIYNEKHPSNKFNEIYLGKSGSHYYVDESGNVITKTTPTYPCLRIIRMSFLDTATVDEEGNLSLNIIPASGDNLSAASPVTCTTNTEGRPFRPILKQEYLNISGFPTVTTLPEVFYSTKANINDNYSWYHNVDKDPYNCSVINIRVKEDSSAYYYLTFQDFPRCGDGHNTAKIPIADLSPGGVAIRKIEEACPTFFDLYSLRYYESSKANYYIYKNTSGVLTVKYSETGTNVLTDIASGLNMITVGGTVMPYYIKFLKTGGQLSNGELKKIDEINGIPFIVPSNIFNDMSTNYYEVNNGNAKSTNRDIPENKPYEMGTSGLPSVGNVLLDKCGFYIEKYTPSIGLSIDSNGKFTVPPITTDTGIEVICTDPVSGLTFRRFLKLRPYNVNVHVDLKNTPAVVNEAEVFSLGDYINSAWLEGKYGKTIYTKESNSLAASRLTFSGLHGWKYTQGTWNASTQPITAPYTISAKDMSDFLTLSTSNSNYTPAEDKLPITIKGLQKETETISIADYVPNNGPSSLQKVQELEEGKIYTIHGAKDEYDNPLRAMVVYAEKDHSFAPSYEDGYVFIPVVPNFYYDLYAYYNQSTNFTKAYSNISAYIKSSYYAPTFSMSSSRIPDENGTSVYRYSTASINRPSPYNVSSYGKLPYLIPSNIMKETKGSTNYFYSTYIRDAIRLAAKNSKSKKILSTQSVNSDPSNNLFIEEGTNAWVDFGSAKTMQMKTNPSYIAKDTEPPIEMIIPFYAIVNDTWYIKGSDIYFDGTSEYKALLLQTISSLEQQVATLNNEITEKTAKIASLNASLSAISLNLTDAEDSTKDEMIAAADALRSEISDLTASLNTARNNLATANGQIQSLSSEVSELTQEASELTERNTQLTQEIEELNTQIANLQAQGSTDAETIAGLNSRVSILTQEKASLNEQIASLNAQVESLLGDKSSLTDSLNEERERNETLTNDKQGLTEQIESLNTTVEGLNTQIEGLNGQVTSLTNEKAALTESVASLTSDKETLEGNISTLNGQIADKNEEIARLTGELESAGEENTSLTESIATLTEEKESLSLEKAQLTSDVASLNSQINTLNQTIEGKNASIASLTENKESLESRVETLLSEKEALEGAKTALEEANASLTSDKDTLTERVAGLTTQVDTLNSQVESLTEEKTTLTENIETLTGQKTALEQNVASLNSEINAKEESIASLTETLTETEGNNEELNNQITSLTEEKAALIEEKNGLNAQIDGLNSQIQTLNNTVSGKDLAIEALTGEKASLTEQVENLTEANALLNESVETLTGEKRELTSQVEGLNSQVASLTSEKNGLISDKNTLTERVETLNTQIEELDRTITGLRESLASKEETNETLNGQIVTLTGQKESLISEKAQLTENIEALNTRISGLNETITSKDTEILSLNEELLRRNEAIATLTGNNEELQGEITSLTNTITSLRDEIASLTEEKASLTSDKEALTRNLEEANSRITSLSRRVESLTAELATANEKISNLETMLRDLLRNHNIELTRGTDEDIINRIDRVLTEYETSIAEKTRALAETNAEIASQAGVIAELRETLASSFSADEMDAVNESLTQARNNLDTLRRQNESLTEEITGLNRELSETQTSLNETRASLNESSSESSERIMALNASLNEKQEQITALTESSRELNGTIDALRGAVAGYEETVGDVRTLLLISDSDDVLEAVRGLVNEKVMAVMVIDDIQAELGTEATGAALVIEIRQLKAESRRTPSVTYASSPVSTSEPTLKEEALKEDIETLKEESASKDEEIRVLREEVETLKPASKKAEEDETLITSLKTKIKNQVKKINSYRDKNNSLKEAYENLKGELEASQRTSRKATNDAKKKDEEIVKYEAEISELKKRVRPDRISHALWKKREELLNKHIKEFEEKPLTYFK